jgi:hypothetical protein
MTWLTWNCLDPKKDMSIFTKDPLYLQSCQSILTMWISHPPIYHRSPQLPLHTMTLLHLKQRRIWRVKTFREQMESKIKMKFQLRKKKPVKIKLGKTQQTVTRFTEESKGSFGDGSNKGNTPQKRNVQIGCILDQQEKSKELSLTLRRPDVQIP